MKLASLRTISLALIVILFNLFIYRTIFSGQLIGEPFDSRLMISLHEHMWRWFNGLVEFRDTEFFYPYKTALGFSDVFLVQGIIYSAFRFFGFDSLSSWLNVTILLVIIGNLGWIVVARKYLRNILIEILFILTMISSLSFVYYFTFNPNIVGYSFLSWFIVFLKNITEENNVIKKHTKIALLIITMLVYALSCWYAVFFITLTLFFKFGISLVIQKQKIRFEFNQRVAKIYLLASPPILFLTWLFYYVYISIAAQPERSIDELLRNSPRIQQIFKGANPKFGGIDGAIFSPIYKSLKLDQIIVYGDKLGDWGGGLGLILPIVTVITIILNSFFSRKFKDFSWILAVLFTYIYLVVFGDDYSIHSYFFNHLPGFNSIRSPSRYVIFVGYASIFIVFYFFDKIYSSSKNLIIKLTVLSTLLVLLLDQQRMSFKGWEREDFINSELESMKSQIQKNCDYFYYDRPGGWWYDQIEALSFAVQIGIPTVNGYSGAYPPGYPIEQWKSTDDPLRIFDWIKKIDKSKRGCLVTGRSSLKPLNQNFSSIDFIGFTGLESKGVSTWRWATSPNPYLYIYDESFKKKIISFNLRTSSCFENQKIRITDSNNNLLLPEYVVNKEKSYNLKVDMTEAIIKRIQLNTDAQACNVGKDPRNLFFEIKDFKIE